MVKSARGGTSLNTFNLESLRLLQMVLNQLGLEAFNGMIVLGAWKGGYQMFWARTPSASPMRLARPPGLARFSRTSTERLSCVLSCHVLERITNDSNPPRQELVVGDNCVGARGVFVLGSLAHRSVLAARPL